MRSIQNWGSEIRTQEYNSLAEQAEALNSGEVDAIIYNEGYTGNTGRGI